MKIVKEPPAHLQRLDMEAIGSQVSFFLTCQSFCMLSKYRKTLQLTVALIISLLIFQITDMDIRKESKPVYFINVILPLLLKNGIVHFLGFGNRLAFDPMPLNLQVYFNPERFNLQIIKWMTGLP